VRFLTSDSVGWEDERYPTTRNSDAFAIRSMYYLPYRAALRFEARAFSDSWGISSQNYEFRYIQPYKENLSFELKLRYYDQDQADFYADLFPFADAQTFLARDKELSQYTSVNLGFGVNYELKTNIPFIDKTTLHFYYDRMSFDYENFRDASGNNSAEFGFGNEPLYSLDANVIRFFISAWY